MNNELKKNETTTKDPLKEIYLRNFCLFTFIKYK